MANPDHLAQLRAGRWNEWRAENPTLAPDLIDAELSGMDLREGFDDSLRSLVESASAETLTEARDLRRLS